AVINRVAQGYEGDVSPRPGGNNNGLLTVSDWVQVGRFVVGLDVAATGNEFQRADVAPRETLGDGRITLVDWVQTGRYVAGVDALPVTGGPASVTSAIGGQELGVGSWELGVGGKSVDSRKTNFSDFTVQNNDGLVTVKLNATGVENALSFSLNFDSSAWRFVSAKPGRHTKQATLLVNSSETAQGRIGIALALPTGTVLRAGQNDIVVLQFVPIRRSRKPLSPAFVDFPIARGLVDGKANLIR
ncbi:MAG: hypothetical protein JNK38_28155, partial [Acidobacteria bacterium]|nr:hypothetical protein [Acidobacteriota bacterium]